MRNVEEQIRDAREQIRNFKEQIHDVPSTYNVARSDIVKMADERTRHPHHVHVPIQDPLAHPSIFSNGGSWDFSLTRCSRSDCGTANCEGRLYHCPLCPPNKCAKEIPSRVKDHFNKVHWENRIEFQGIHYKILHHNIVW